MGAGRKTETYRLAQDGQYISGYSPLCVRNLKKGDLCGVIFGCKFSTIKECYAKNLFGLPAQHMAYIKNIDPGLTLFLFNYSDRTLHGIFEAASEGKLNIDPKAWSENETDPSPYPAQVKVRVRVPCEPLPEEKFSPVISENYMDDRIFLFELDRNQTNKLLRLFSPSVSVRNNKDALPPPRKPIPASSLAQIGDLGATRVDKWSNLFKSSDKPSGNIEKDSKEGSHGADSRLVDLGKYKGWETASKNADERKSQPPVSQSGESYSSVLRNVTTSSTNEVASQGVVNPWTPTSRVQESIGLKNASKEGEDYKMKAYHRPQNLHPTLKGPSATANNLIGPSITKEDSADDTYSVIDWDASSSFQPHLDGLNEILKDTKDNNCFKNASCNMGTTSSSLVPDSWEDSISWDNDERTTTSMLSYVTVPTRGVVDNIRRIDHFQDGNGTPKLLDIMSDIFLEVKMLKNTQVEQANRILKLEIDLVESKLEILRLKRRNVSF